MMDNTMDHEERKDQHGRSCTGLELLRGQGWKTHKQWKLSTSCPILDKLLRGGFLSGVLTEITGESGSGKTQLCLQLCLSVQTNRDHASGAVYMCTEDVFPSKRLQEMIQQKVKDVPGHKFGDHIFIEHVADFDTLDFCVENKLPALLHHGCVGVVVVDSVTALFRCHYDSTQAVERAKHLTQFATRLQKLATQHNIPIICVNQVSANFSSESPSSVVPALGLTWSHQVACRLMMAHPSPPLPDPQGDQDGRRCTSPVTWRQLQVLYAPHLPTTEIRVCIDSRGIHGMAR